MGDFFGWASSLTNSDVIALVGAAGGTLTAVFTGITTYLALQQSRQSISGEWSVKVTNSRLEGTCRVHNGTSGTLDLQSVEASGPIGGVFTPTAASASVKHESWGPNMAPIGKLVSPGSHVEFHFHIDLSVADLQKGSGSLVSRARESASRWLWTRFKLLAPQGPKVSITAIARRRSAPKRAIFLRHEYRMYWQTAMQIAENKRQSAEKAT